MATVRRRDSKHSFSYDPFRELGRNGISFDVMSGLQVAARTIKSRSFHVSKRVVNLAMTRSLHGASFESQARGRGAGAMKGQENSIKKSDLMGECCGPVETE